MLIKNLSNYIFDVRSELKKISWATKDITLRSSLLVFTATVIASTFFLLIDFISYKIVTVVLGAG